MNNEKLQILLAKFANITTSSILTSTALSIEAATIAPFIGTSVEELIINVGTEFSDRHLSKRENYRLGMSISELIANTNKNFEEGKTLREDNFFDKVSEDRKTIDELFEGVLLSIKLEHEEKKIKYISRMFSNFLFDTQFDHQFCNTYLRVAQNLTYRQFCYLFIIANKEKYGLNKEIQPFKDPYRALRGDQIIELLEMRSKALIFVPEIFSKLDPKHGYQMFPLDSVHILDLGKYLYELLELVRIDIMDVEELCNFKIKPN